MTDAPRPWIEVGVRAQRDYTIFKTRTLDVLDPRTRAPYVRTVIDAPDWVNVVASTSDGRLILVRQFRFGTWSNTLEIPGGMLDGREAPEVAAARELEEETGYRPGTLVALGTSHPNPAIFGNRLHSYAARDCVQVHQGRPDASEDLEVVLAARSELPGLIARGEVSHSLVLAALLLEKLAP